ncbi:hypothetical protein [uncultured Thiodictyon sp.]|jgi:hypothetical protein|uniref:hypothetical protein n=1 Tax=uncultured Thiodictyon sp. TaxID=1846217 RepID=UPI0025E1E45B|nr:hypothetical protein [uncultured Thiodictyon sp.]
MKTLETDVEINPDGSIKLLSPLPAWLTPGRRRLLLVVDEPLSMSAAPPAPETLLDTLRRLRKLGTFSKIDDPVAWQRKIRRDRPL